MTVWVIVGVSCIGVIAAVMLRSTQPVFSICLAIAVGVLLIVLSLSELSVLVDRVMSFFSYTTTDMYTTVLMKALGIGLLTQFTADVCRDAGETSLAGKTEFAGRVLLLVCGMPLFEYAAVLLESIIRGQAVGA